MSEPVNSNGFAVPRSRPLSGQIRLAQLAAIAGLTISTIVALTAITVGVAHAGVVDGVVGNEGGLFTVALLLGLIFIAVGGFTLLPPGEPRQRR